MGHILTKLQFPTSSFRGSLLTDIYRLTDRQTPAKTIPARSIAGAQVIKISLTVTIITCAFAENIYVPIQLQGHSVKVKVTAVKKPAGRRFVLPSDTA